MEDPLKHSTQARKKEIQRSPFKGILLFFTRFSVIV